VEALAAIGFRRYIKITNIRLMENGPKIKKKVVSFITYFIMGFGFGFFICVLGGFFHWAPDIMWKETFFISSTLGILSGFGGELLFEQFMKFINYIF
jgi:hypothetical protein